MATAPQPPKRRSMSLDPSTVHRKQLTVTIIEAKAVAPKKEAEKISAYCVVSCNNVCFRTHPQAGTKPEWKQKFTFNEKDIQDDDASLSIVCWSHQKYSKDAFLGQVVIPLASLNGNVAIKQWWPFAPRDDADKNVTGKINLEIQLITDASVIKKKNSAIGKKMKRKLSWEDKKSDGEAQNAFESTAASGAQGAEGGADDAAEKAQKSSSSSSSTSSSDSDSEAGGEKPANTETAPAADAAATATDGGAETGGPRDDDTDAESMVPSNVRDSIELTGRRNDDAGTDTEGGVDVDQLRGNIPRSPRRLTTKTEEDDIAFPPKGAKKKASTGNDEGVTSDAGAVSTTDVPLPVAEPASAVKIPKKRRAAPSIDSQNPATDSGAESSEITSVVRPVVPVKSGKRKKPPVPKKATKVTTPAVPGLEPVDHSEDREERSGSSGARKDSMDGNSQQEGSGKEASSSGSASAQVPATGSSAQLAKPASPVRKKSSIFGFVARLGSVLKQGGSSSAKNSPTSTPGTPGTPSKTPDSGKTPATPGSATSTGSASTSTTTAPPAQALTVEEILQQKPEIDSSEELLGSDDEAPRPGAPRRGGKPSFKRRAKKQPASGSAALVRVQLGSSGSAPAPAQSSSSTSNAVSTEPVAPSSPRGKDIKDLPSLPPKASGTNLAVAPPISPRTKPQTTDGEHSSSSDSDSESENEPSARDSQQLEEVKAQVTALRKDFAAKVEELTGQRESLKEEVARLRHNVSDLERQIESKTKVIEEKDKTIDALRKENMAPRRPAVTNSQETSLLEAQLRRETEQREMAEKKAMDFMNQFLTMTNVMKQRSEKESDLVNKVLALETELERLRRQLAAATSAPSSSAPSANGAVPSAAVAAANASFEFDFAKERRAFEDLFERGRREIVDVIERGKSALANAAAGGDDSEVPTDNEKIDIPLRKKKRTPKPGRANRASSVSDNDSGSAVSSPSSAPPSGGLKRIASVSVNETAMKIELDQLRKELSTVKQQNSELTSRLSTLQRRNSVTLSAPIVAVPPPVNRPVVPPVPTAQPGTPTSARDTPSSESERSGSPAPMVRANSLTSPRLMGSSQELSAVTSQDSDDTGPQLSSGKKSKKLKSVRFHGDVSSDEQTGKGPSWRDSVRKTLGIPKKKPVPATGPSPWRKPPEMGGGPITVKKPNKVDWNRSEQSYWSDDVDSDTYGPGGATSGNESMPTEFPSHRQADDSDFSENDYGGSDGGSASGSLPRQVVLSNTVQ